MPQRPRDAQPFQLGRASGQAEEASPVLNEVQSFLLEVLDDLAREGAIICEPAIGGLCRKRAFQGFDRELVMLPADRMAIAVGGELDAEIIHVLPEVIVGPPPLDEEDTALLVNGTPRRAVAKQRTTERVHQRRDAVDALARPFLVRLDVASRILSHGNVRGIPAQHRMPAMP